MYCMHTNVGNFRSERKCSTISGRCLFMLGMLVLLLSCVSCRPADEEFDGFPEEYADVDNIEWHHVKIVDGVVQPEDHPVIFYKEDFVSEDYDPAKERLKNATDGVTAHRTRKYKELSRRHRTDAEQYRALKPEKMYFDVLPQSPLVVADDSSANDSKFDASKIRVEVISLADDTTEQQTEDEATKQILSKRPKKYRRRQRRDTSMNEHSRQKRNPNYSESDFVRVIQTILSPAYQQQKRQPLKGVYYNAVSLPATTSIGVKTRFGPEDEKDVVIWGSNTNKQILSKRPKKYRRRQRRDTSMNEHSRQKRNPNYSESDFVRVIQTILSPAYQQQKRHPVKGVYYNAFSLPEATSIGVKTRFGPEDEKDVVIWGSIARNEIPTERPQPPLFHDSTNWDTSFLNNNRPTAKPSTARTQPPLFQTSNSGNWIRPSQTTTSRPPRTQPPLFHDSNPDTWDTGFLTRPPPAQSSQTSRPSNTNTFAPYTEVPSAKDVPRASITDCIWAIVQCCSPGRAQIRYQCFESMGCYGAFWDLNPCADQIQEAAGDFVRQNLD